MKDLEIRGAGNLLGVEQSGHIAAVGFDLYCRLLADSIEELKGKKAGGVELGRVSFMVSAILLPAVSYIPEDYISDLNNRMTFYRRLATINKFEEIEDIADELEDRFGVLPKVVKNLLYTVEIKQLAIKAKAESIVAKDNQIIAYFDKGQELDKVHLLRYGRTGVTVGTRQIKLDMRLIGDNWQDVLREILQLIIRNV